MHIRCFLFSLVICVQASAHQTTICAQKLTHIQLLRKDGLLLKAVPVLPYFAKTTPHGPTQDKTIILTLQERERYRLIVKDGLFYNTEGELIDTQDTDFIYILTTNGDFYATERILGKIYHNSLAAGEPVALAGAIEIHNGRLVNINDSASHYYFADRTHLSQGLAVLRDIYGIDLTGVQHQHAVNPIVEMLSAPNSIQ
jgi:hypothetical protein